MRLRGVSEMILHRRLCKVILLVCLTGMIGFPSYTLAADNNDACAAIIDDASRLRCYDEANGRKPEEPVGMANVPDSQAKPANEPSYLSKKWQLDDESRKTPFAIVPYRANYFLALAYNFNPNKEVYEKPYPDFDMQYEEVKFQISLKVKLWESIFKSNTDLWFGYTQLSFWQLYNTADSCPFRETNYEPEILFNYRMNADIFGLVKNRFIQVGFNHQSNGLGGSLSRSWNRIVANFGFERGAFDLVLRTWFRIPENESNDDNPDILAYMGYGDIAMGYHWKDWAVGALFRNNLRLEDNRSALQLDVSFPLVRSINGYLQYFVGYGESLIDYDHFNNRIGIGVMVKDW
jgi:phospholipase A1/A2